MKFQVLSSAILATLLLASCGGGAETETTAETTSGTTNTAPVSYSVSSGDSKLMWTGTMLGVKSHNGLVTVTDGAFTLEGGKLTEGKFAVDLKTIAPLDTNYAPDGSEQGTKSMLIGHLQSADFFAVDSFPMAKFVLTGVEGTTATGDLTVRGKTNSEQVTDLTITESEGKATATGKLVFDRQKYGVAWASPMKDMVLSDDIELEFEITGMAR
ncbi:MAG: YceI family protein [Flavobacteriales bacterium]|nr:YceI family protein [Flavobacteriales bacterium]